jgi:hypothetical protein
MAKRVLWIVVFVIVAGFLYFGYTNYDAGRAATNGEVYSNDQPSGRHRSNDVSSEDSRDTKSASQPIVYPTPNQPPASVVSNGQTTQPGISGGAIPASGVPANETQGPNAPNGMRFSGPGKYLLYRQGDITYRLDTDTGFSCIIYATDEQWKIPRVYSDGCGKK